jgi:hypothetical protein
LAFSDLFSRLKRGDAQADTDAVAAPVSPEISLSTGLTGRPSRCSSISVPSSGQRVVLRRDLGCKIIVEDLAKDIDRHVSGGVWPNCPFLEKRIAATTRA